jgi:hypothetical protein
MTELFFMDPSARLKEMALPSPNIMFGTQVSPLNWGITKTGLACLPWQSQSVHNLLDNIGRNRGAIFSQGPHIAMVFLNMLTIVFVKHKILDAIVGFIFAMMNAFILRQFTAKVLFHDLTVKENALVTMTQTNISVLGHLYAFSSGSVLDHGLRLRRCAVYHPAVNPAFQMRSRGASWVSSLVEKSSQHWVLMFGSSLGKLWRNSNSTIDVLLTPIISACFASRVFARSDNRKLVDRFMIILLTDIVAQNALRVKVQR